MNSLQENILRQYRSKFPNDTLKEISHKTGIQITRVHRIFSGAEMKISEFEAVEKALAEKDESITGDLISTTYRCLTKLKASKLHKILATMNYALKIEELKNHDPSFGFSNIQSA